MAMAAFCPLLLASKLAWAQGAAAQRVAPRPALADREAVRADPGVPERDARAIVVANAAPRSFRVVSVAIPAELGTVEHVQYAVTATGTATILGPREGSIVAGPASSGLVLTVGVPAAALGGRTRVAVVRFVAAGGRAAVRVPIELDVAGVSRIEITPKRPMRGALRGDRVDVSFSIRNAGNVRDTIQLTVDAPGSWSTRFTEPPRVVLEPGESIERTIIVNVPTSSDLGDFGIALVAAARAGASGARGTTTIEVTDGMRPGFQTGPLVTAGVGSASSSGTDARTVESIALQGQMSDALTVAGRITTPLPSDPVASRALTILGYSPRSSFLSLTATNWSATLGNTGATLSALGGQSVFGRGGSTRFGGGAGNLRLLAATPNVGGAASWDQGSLIAASGDARIGTSTVTAFLAHLRDSSYTVRALDVAGVGVDLRPWADGTVSGQLAARSYRGGSGLGAAGAVQGPIAGGQLDVQLTHAPGGTDAFALASDALTAALVRSFGRLRTEASYWATRDQAAASDDLSSSGWSFSPTYPILPSLSIGAYVQGSSFASGVGDGRFVSNQRDLGARGVLLAAGFELSADSRLSTIARAIDGASQLVNDDSRRVTNRLRLDHAGARGEFGIGGSLETRVVGAASMPPQTTMDAHIERLQLVPMLPHLTLSGAAQRLRFGDATLTTSRLEADLDLQRSTRIALGIERGTARDEAGVLRTVLTLKVERAARLPALGHRSASGVVFEDRNGNGVRDPGEPGVSGIVVRRGSQSAVTDRDGVFRLDEAAPGRTEIDARSLPSGWLATARSIASISDDHALGVIPTAALDVDVKLAGAADGSASPVRVGRASLALRDTAGRVWVARTDAASHANFDALPVGRYTLAAELDESSEPLVVDATSPIEITGAVRRQHVTVTVRTRPLRMFRGQP